MNKDLDALVVSDHFRQDLYNRINVMRPASTAVTAGGMRDSGGRRVEFAPLLADLDGMLLAVKQAQEQCRALYPEWQLVAC